MLLLRLTLLFLLHSFILQAQPIIQKGGKHQLDPHSKLIRQAYNYSFEKSVDKHFIYKQFYPETQQLTHLISYKSSKRKQRHGRNAEWYDDGRLIFDGQYKQGKKSGHWIESNFGSFNNYQVGEYLDDHKTGKWRQVDSLGTLLRVNHYKAGELDGLSQYYDKEGTLFQEEIYANGELIEVTLEDGKVDSDSMEVVEIMPSFPGCEAMQIEDSVAYNQCAQNLMLRHIYKKIRYPEVARENSVEGMAIVRFVVVEDGSIEEIEVLRGLCESIKSECLRVVKSMPKWHPGYQKNKPVKVFFFLPVQFRLE